MTMRVVEEAIKVYNGNFSELSSMPSLRFLLVYPTAISFKLLGIELSVIKIFPIFCSACLIVVTFYIGKLLFDEKIGLLSAVLLSFYPLDIYVGSVIFPDGPLSFFISLSILLFIIGNQTGHKKNLYFFSSGLCIGLGFLIKETAMFIAIFFVIDILINRKIHLSHFIIASGFLIVVLIDSFYLFSLTGNFFHRFEMILNAVGGGKAISVGSGYDPSYSMRQKWLYFFWFSVPLYNYGMFFYFAFSGALYLFFTKSYQKKNVRIVLTWFLGLLLYISLGSLISKFAHATQLPRYMSVITVPTVVIIAVFLREYVLFLNKKIFVVSLIVLFFTSMIAVGFDRLRNEKNYADIQAANYIQSVDYSNVYSNPKTIRILKFLNNYEQSFKYKRLSAGSNVLAENDIVIVNKHRDTLSMKRHGEVFGFNRMNLQKLKEINNPAPASSYWLAKMLNIFAEKSFFLPNAVKQKLIRETNNSLEYPDSLIYRVVQNNGDELDLK